MSETVATIRRRVAQKVRYMNVNDARAMLDRILAEGTTIYHPDIYELTGGYQGEWINTMVTRKLAEQAGMFPKV
jgi:hypothetical protein